jgi:predicted transposase YbfD/YdcC
MHFTVKKTLQQLVEQGNHYVVTVKGNQGTLKKQFEQAQSVQLPLTQSAQLDTSHGRWVERFTRVYTAPPEVIAAWPQAKSLIVVERYGEREGYVFSTISYYLSDLQLEAKDFALTIRGHRDIENGLHWVRDVVLGEDDALLTRRISALNWATLRSIVLNLFRADGHTSLTQAIRMFAHDIPALISILIKN